MVRTVLLNPTYKQSFHMANHIKSYQYFYQEYPSLILNNHHGIFCLILAILTPLLTGIEGFEPSTLRIEVACSIQLSYIPMMLKDNPLQLSFRFPKTPTQNKKHPSRWISALYCYLVFPCFHFIINYSLSGNLWNLLHLPVDNPLSSLLCF